jgi:hypothetical protein
MADSDSTADQLPPPAHPNRSRVYWFFTAAILALTLTRIVPVAVRQLQAPFDLIYESPNLTTIQAIKAGRNVYDPHIYLEPPFHLTIYTPLYHYLVAALPASEHNRYLAGRLVAMTFMILAAATPLLIDRGRPGGFLWPVTSNTVFLKTDGMALCFAALAVVTAAGAASVRNIIVASLLCTLALATKQSYVAATIACFAYFFVARRRAGVLFMASFLLMAAVVFGGGYLAWGDGFRYSVAEAVRQPFLWAHFRQIAIQMARQPLFVVVFGSSLVGLAAAMFRPAQFRASPYGYYALASWLVLMATVGKLGSSTNYFVEPCLAILMFAVSILKTTAIPFRVPRLGMAFCVLVTVLLVVDLAWAKPENYTFVKDAAESEARVRANVARNNAIRAIRENPRILNLAAATLTGDLPGDVSVNDPYLYLLVWQYERLPEGALVRCLNERYYDIVIVPNDFGADSLWDQADGQRVQRIVKAVAENYPERRQGPDVTFLLPRGRRVDR